MAIVGKKEGKDRENKTYGTLLDGIMCRFIY